MSQTTYEEHLKKIMKALVYIEEHLDEALSVEKLAKHCFISAFHFHRIFKAFVGENIGEYIKRLRVEMAMGQLCYTEEKITEISFNAGYETPSSFTKTFTKLIGISPKKYREKFKPIVKYMLKQTQKKDDSMQKPKIVHRQDETVLFIRKVGDYQHKPKEAFQALTQFVEKHHLRNKVQAVYGIPLDNPEITEKEKLRFDACIKVSDVDEMGEVGKKTIQGGKYAVFDHFGKYEAIGDTFEKIFSTWYPNSGEVLEEKPIFCEYPDSGKDIPEEKRRTIIYIPIV